MDMSELILGGFIVGIVGGLTVAMLYGGYYFISAVMKHIKKEDK